MTDHDPQTTAPSDLPSVAGDVLDGYRPRGVAPDVWQTVRPVVAAALAEVDDESVARNARYALSRVAAHVHELGHTPTLALLFDEAMLANWLSTVGSANSAATHRAMVRRIARMHQPARAAARRPIPQPDPVVERYTNEQVDRMLAHAEALPTPVTRLSALGLVLAGVGAGLDGYDLLTLPATNVHRDGDLVLVDVLGTRCHRTVAVLHRYADQLVDVARAQQARDPGCMLIGGGGSKNRTSNVRGLFTGWGGPDLHATALRTTWLATHLAAGTPNPVLFAQAGVQSATAHIEQLIVELAADMDQRQVWRVAADAERC